MVGADSCACEGPVHHQYRLLYAEVKETITSPVNSYICVMIRGGGCAVAARRICHVVVESMPMREDL